MTISDEAVEAAAKASFEFMEDMEWGLANFLDKALFRDAARRTLVAAAPHLMESAFVRGYQSALACRGSIRQDRSRRAPRWSRKHRAAGAGE